MRLDYFLAHTTSWSRKEAKRFIAKGKIRVNGDVVTKPNASVTEDCKVESHGEVILWRKEKYFALYKPADYVSALEDSESPVLIDLIEPEERKNLKIVGRLDKDTTGLIFLTTDGQWLHRITSPKHDCYKTYRVYCADPISEANCKSLETGVMLNGEDLPTSPAKVERVSDTEILLSIKEGKYHQVKRMLAAVGNRVEKLHREAISDVNLDGLQEGQYRILTEDEIFQF
ncbi:pseudouridine synthase [Marinomonas mediterranea]|uniref:Pseudouridine synthase n=1 Tax=Marinomonas mediterranea (strain ATCC 700492 / JCM 21426 / NBRC 103028 / MMB-1) TaxID=717774 RepID=F2K2Y0_MARM1|nr:pseudouridine synthase [Marinomonas mediterranea]ADZ92369.1 pseudouridine synthase Rsu [Marinomonas mediterranea MMB-1]WCN14366.1 pseudouridine synthase [Marinomonas mediterranea]WCN18418.1 pseudouridine synthase [Marinomonas mediterranea MMB-1]